MKRLSKKVDVEQMCVLHARNADISRTGKIQQYIAFGDWTDHSDGPSVRFHGGTPFTGKIDNAPVMQFNIYGDCIVAPSMWMNVHNCPNVFEESYLNQVTHFIQKNLPILYLVYERYLDKTDALAYFEGRIDWGTMLSSVYRIAEDLYAGLLTCENCAQLHMFCIHQNVYGETEVIDDRSLLCSKLERQLHPVFELSLEGDSCVLRKYNGRSETVHIPENVDTIGENAFFGHNEIKKIIFPDALENIQKGAFCGCSGIEMLTLPLDIWGISEDAFAECTQLQQVCFEHVDHELYLEQGAFRGCKSLREIVLPHLTIPEGNPFADCPNLRICCNGGSYAERYAKANNIPYVCETGGKEE